MSAKELFKLGSYLGGATPKQVSDWVAKNETAKSLFKQVGEGLDTASVWSQNNPWGAGAIGLGTIAATIGAGSLLGGGGDDDMMKLMLAQQMASPQGGGAEGSINPSAIPNLNPADRKRQIDYLERKIATDVLTVQALKRQQSVDPTY